MQRVAEEGHELLAKHGEQEEDSPQPVYDAGNGRQQIDQKRQRLAQPGRREVGQEDRTAERQRRRDDQRDDRGDDRAGDRRRRTELSGYGIPRARREELQAEL